MIAKKVKGHEILYVELNVRITPIKINSKGEIYI